MKYYSEIFENYTKLAMERGLITFDRTLSKKAEDNSRYDSLSIKEIEGLYGVKPTSENSKDILDQAHPDPVIIAPAHDKINGLVENLKERHNIMVGIATKPTNGVLTQHIYVSAHQQLLNELLKVGFLLDRENQIELMSLADSCSERLTKIANPLLIAALIAAGVGTIYSIISQNMHLSQGVVQDSEKALVELGEAISSYSEHPELKKELDPLIDKIKAIKEAGEKIAAIQLHPIVSSEKSQAQIASAAFASLQDGKDIEAIGLMAGFGAGCGDLAKSLDDYISVLKIRSQQYESTHSDWFEPLRRGYRALIPSDIEDAIGALEALKQSCSASPAQMEAMIKLFRELRAKGSQSVDELKQKLQGKDLEPDKPESAPPVKPPPIKA